MHRDLWFGLRGYDEGLRRASLWADNDLFLRAGQRHPWLDTCSFGVVSYHMEHASALLPPKPRAPEKVNAMTYGPSYAVNGEDWGLGGQDLPRLRAVPGRDAGQLPLLPPWRDWADVLDTLRQDRVVPMLGRLGLHLADDGKTSLDGERLGKLVAWLRRTFGDAAVRDDARHHDLVAVLTAFGQTRHPLRVHHFGRLDALLSWLLLVGCPAAELYLETPWPSGTLDDLPLNPGPFSGILGMARFRGYTRVVTTPPGEMLDVLAHDGAGCVELAVVDAATVGDGLPTILARCEAGLCPGGMIVVHGLAQECLPAPTVSGCQTIVTPQGLGLRFVLQNGELTP